MLWQIKKFSVYGLLCCLIILQSCGYTMRGQEGSRSENSVLGTGGKTIKIKAVEQPTLYTWLPYMLRSQMRDEINARSLAIWKDDGTTDFDMVIKVNYFQVRAYGQSREVNLLFTASADLEIILYSGSNSTPVWKSGSIGYSENYQNINEELAVREIVQSAVRRAVDRLQQKF